MERYDVLLGDEIVGNVGVTREGLYLRFSCKSKLPDSKIYRLMVLCDGKKTDLGICVPEGDCFVLDRKVQRKCIGEGKLRFCVSPNESRSNECFVAIDPKKPFPFLSSLQNASFQKLGNCYGIQLSEEFLMSHPSMQNCRKSK